MSVDADLDALSRQRLVEAEARLEQERRRTQVKVAKINARRDVKEAHADSMLRIGLQLALGVMVLIAFLTALTMHYSKPMSPEVQIQRQKSSDARYEACLQKGGHYYSGSQECDLP
jgi:hypothetical protein